MKSWIDGHLTISLDKNHKDGSATYSFDYDEMFIEGCKKHLGWKRISLIRIARLIAKALENTIKYHGGKTPPLTAKEIKRGFKIMEKK